MTKIQQNDMYSKSGIVPHWKEAIDLRELFVLLTYQCNQNCPFCIEPKLHKEGFITTENFKKALVFAEEKGLKTIYLHGGEPTIHPNVVEFAKMAKEAGFLVKMFTNGIEKEKIKEMDGILDTIFISYRGDYSLMYNQTEWKSPLVLYTYVTEEIFPTLESLKDFFAKAKKTGMTIKVHTLNPVNQWAYDHQYVSYLEKIFLEIPDDEIYCVLNKVSFDLDGIRIIMANKSLNPAHLKYSMDSNGETHEQFDRGTPKIVKNDELEKKLAIADEKVRRLREIPK